MLVRCDRRLASIETAFGQRLVLVIPSLPWYLYSISLNNVFKSFLFNYDIIRYIHPASSLDNYIPCSVIYDIDILLFFPVH